jgi:ABC-type nitrate/sulfonate/bicarbonate transport system ATPase subunit
MSTRDNFSPATKETLAKRVGWRCSNPDCRKLTIGPHEEDTKSVNIGVAAHITAAASGVGAKRYDPNLSTEERKAITNGIWLCQNCGKLVDSNEPKYSVELLLNWKRDAENRAALEVENANQAIADDISLGFRNYLKNLVNEPQKWWLDEINDLTWVEFPLSSITKEKPKKPDEQPKNTPPQLVLDAIKSYTQEKILIVGPPGAGKSTLLSTICKQAAARAIEDPQAPIPVLVELRDYKAGEGFRGFILQNLQSHDQCLDEGHFKKLLQEGRLLLLVDGLNENPEAKSELKTFCRNVPLIATGRQDSDGWEIERKLELQPLSTEQVKCFFELRLPDADRAQVQALGDRVKDFGQTPLMVWMLYSIFRANKDVPETRGEAYRSFTTLYSERAKEGIDLSDARLLLGKLAFEMMRSSNDDPTDFRLKISEVEAQTILGSEATLKRMLNHLLKQQGKPGNREISFCHQSLQEYYAAEYLMSDRQRLLEWLSISPNHEYSIFQQDYLNYQKWTESVALMLALVEDEALAVRVVELALEVDPYLGAKLIGSTSEVYNLNLIIMLLERIKINSSKVSKKFKRDLIKCSLRCREKRHLIDILLNKCGEANSKYRDLKVICVELLSERNEPEVINALFKVAEKSQEEVCKASITALSKNIGEKDIHNFLTFIFKKNDDQDWFLEEDLFVFIDEVLTRLEGKEIFTYLKSNQDVQKICSSIGNSFSGFDYQDLRSLVEDSLVVEDYSSTEYCKERVELEEEERTICHEYKYEHTFVTIPPRAGRRFCEYDIDRIESVKKDLKSDDIKVFSRAIGKIQDDFDGQILETLIERSDWVWDAKNSYIVEKISKIFFQFHDPDNCQRVFNSLCRGVDVIVGNSPDSKMKGYHSYLLLALGRVGGEKAFIRLSDLLRNHNLRVRFDAIKALHYVDHEDRISLLCETLNDPDSSVRRDVMCVLGQIGDIRSLGSLYKICITEEVDHQGSVIDISWIQNKYKFYNYEIEQQAEKLRKADRASLGDGGDDRSVIQNFYGSVYGVAGNVEGNQIISPPPDLLN